MKYKFRKVAKVALVLIYLVIAAGAIVRMTGSGMGCPDWPKCFGYYIPPTDISELEFIQNHFYNKGMVVIKDEILYVASKSFTTGTQFNLDNWTEYTTHDYAIFNPIHTWVEYINRLIGALSGLPVIGMFVLSFFFWKDKKIITILSTLTLLGLGFQAWLGKTVVDSNLAPYKITLHMIMALIIVAMILYVIFKSKTTFKTQQYNSTFHKLLILGIVLSLIQIILGTQVRQFVDENVKLYGDVKTLWLNQPNLTFYIHRSFSILVLVVNVLLLRCNYKMGLNFNKVYLVITGIGIEIITGIAMYYFDFPFSTQSIHLFIATVIIGIQYYIFLESSHFKKKIV